MFIKYRDRGLSLIPLVPGTKRPAIRENWQQYCERLPTEEECWQWEREHRAYGLALGPASGVMALDIDSDDARVLNACPPSPVRKRGRKGETRFFRYDADIPSMKVAGIIDVLALGRQTVMPPTLHPDTGAPYVWLTPDTLDDFDPADLPRLTFADIEDIRRALGEPVGDHAGSDVSLAGPFVNDDSKRMCPHGSHDRLKRIVGALIARGASPDEAVRELLRYDEENHLPTGYFKDPTRPDCFADPVSNALYFYASNLRTFNRREARAGRHPSVPLVSGSEIMDVSAVVPPAPQAFRAVEWPEPKGLLLACRDLIAGLSVRRQPALAMGGALAMGSVAIANRIRMGSTWPNAYILNVAPTGAGKSFPYAAAKLVFNPENGLDLLGSGGYRSSSAILKDLIGRRERLDLIDECSGLFKVIRDGGVFQQDMLDILSALWSDSGTVFLGPESAGRERVQVWNACVSSLMSTTPDGLKNSISREFVVQGFLPRCVVFHDPEYGEMGRSTLDKDALQAVVGGFQELQKAGREESAQRNYMSPKANPDDIETSAEARGMLEEYARASAERLALPDTEETERHFLSRAAQQAAKLALIHGALWRRRVGGEDVQWAIDTLAASWHNASPIFPQIGAENAQETNVVRVLTIIRAAGSIPHSRLIGKTRFLRTSERHEILMSLETEGRIRSSTDGRTKVWHIV